MTDPRSDTTEQYPRIVFCGMFGALSRAPLAALLAAGLPVVAVVVPTRQLHDEPAVRRLTPAAHWSPQPRSPRDLKSRTIVDLAWAAGIPVVEVARLSDGVGSAALAPFAPDLIAVSCFPLLFPSDLLALPPLGAINLHPSLLPRGRGPDPLFWYFRDRSGERAGQGGVTIHLMTGRLDTGPIVAQDHFARHDGLTAGEVELRAAATGAELLAGAVRDLAAGSATPRAQDERDATTFPLPGPDDYLIESDCPADWAFNFLRGTAGGRFPHRLRIGDKIWLIHAAERFDPGGRLPAPYQRDGDLLTVQCAPGTLTLRATSLAETAR